MNAAARSSPSRDILTSVYLPHVRALFVALAAFTLAGCSGNASENTEEAATTTQDQGKEIFAPAWSTNAAPPPEAGGIHEIGSVLDNLSFNTLGMGASDKPTAQPAPPTAAPATAGVFDKSAGQWTIALAVFRGENSDAEANQALNRVRQQGKLPDAYIQRRGPASLVAFGRYAGPSDARAQADLERIQKIQVGGAPAFTGAYLCPPFQGQAQSQMGEWDLRRAKQAYGDRALYTLQVGWYGREELERADEAQLKESRKAAEDAVSRLRAEGEMAFYYHGPNRSMVTIGVFDTNDFDPVKQPGYESARLKEIRKRHPHNLYNGAGYSYKAPAMREARLLSSGLVVIPTK